MRIFRTVFLIVMVLGLMAFSPASQQQVVQAAGSSIVYNLYATDGYNLLADGTVAYMYGFVGGRQGAPLTVQSTSSTGAKTSFTLPGGAPAPTGGSKLAGDEAKLAGNAQFPAPLIYATVGDVVTINLKNLGVTTPNAPNDPHTIHLHGLDVDAANDGVPETSVAAVPANAGVPGAGNVVVYMFAPKYPGSYMYHCHQEADIHVQMGMYGALIIYEKGSAGSTKGPGYGGTLWGWHYDKDVVLLLSEEDLGQHVSEQFGNMAKPPAGYVAFNPVDYHPQYWFINGLSFPNTIHAAGTAPFVWNDWIASHPGYDPFITGSVSKGEKVLIRMINMGFETQPMHMHAFHGKVLGSDQRPWVWGNIPGLTPTGIGLEKNTITIGSGETYEWLIDFKTQQLTSTYPVGTQTRYDPNTLNPVSNTMAGNPLDPEIHDLAGGDPYIGGPVVTGAQGVPMTGQLFPFHNHDDYKATNNGDYPGGMFTMIEPLP